MINKKMLATCDKPVVNILKRQETFSIVQENRLSTQIDYSVKEI